MSEKYIKSEYAHLWEPQMQLAYMEEVASRIENTVTEQYPPSFRRLPGLIRTYIRICKRTMDTGGDFMQPLAKNPEFAALPSDLKQLEEQLNVIFGPVAKIKVVGR